MSRRHVETLRRRFKETKLHKSVGYVKRAQKAGDDMKTESFRAACRTDEASGSHLLMKSGEAFTGRGKKQLPLV